MLDRQEMKLTPAVDGQAIRMPTEAPEYLRAGY